MPRVFFATNRDRKTPPTHFSKRFSRNGIADLRFGRAEVDDERVAVTVAEENLQPDDTGQDTDAESILGSLEVFDALRTRMLEQEEDTVIFIHGYNVTFTEGLREAAQLSHRLAAINGNKGASVAVFSWPSDGSLLPWKAYASDRRDAAASGPALARGILKLADYLRGISRQDACQQRVHLIAHSMGNYVLRHACKPLSITSEFVFLVFSTRCFLWLPTRMMTPSNARISSGRFPGSQSGSTSTSTGRIFPCSPPTPQKATPTV